MARGLKILRQRIRKVRQMRASPLFVAMSINGIDRGTYFQGVSRQAIKDPYLSSFAGLTAQDLSAGSMTKDEEVEP